ncbi:asparaginase [Kribbella albertanoniae]|uniref:Asparaginase n=1 Tax=Kribbella albertanoniae TaxID=1266829 RepID=A0A4V2XQI7_9ACTN|nr:asparaginase [Kribbella albertanoniae]TDC26215.1 asparaginase [Kribbella albertanoniae]
MSEPVILADVVRSGFVEGHHRGSVVVTEPDGSVSWSVGITDQPMFPRSSNKPMQAVGMLRHGLPLEGKLLSLAGASHSGETFHVDGVREILVLANLDESALQTPPAYPIEDAVRDAWVRAGHGQESVVMNCSGKHAAMLLTCVTNGWPIGTYRSPDHPLQQAIRAAVEDIAGEKVSYVAVDGCGAPILAISLAGLARSFGLFAAAAPGTLEAKVKDAFRAYPEYASGSTRDEAALMRAVPGLFCKVGAEAVYAVGLEDGRGIALKIEDGTPRARAVVMAAVLRKLGVEHEVIEQQSQFPLLGGGVEVGSVRPHAPAFG